MSPNPPPRGLNESFPAIFDLSTLQLATGGLTPVSQATLRFVVNTVIEC